MSKKKPSIQIGGWSNMKLKSKLHRLFMLTLSVTVAITFSPEALALTRSDYVSNGILFYDQSGEVCTDISVTTVAGDNNTAKIWNYLIGKGLKDFQAAGILGNIKEESGSTYSPNVSEFGQQWPKGGYGIVQWTGGRRTQLMDKIEQSDPSLMGYYSAQYKTDNGGTDFFDANGVRKGIPVEINDKFLSLQLDFLFQESTTRKVRSGWGVDGKTEWESILASTTLREASDIWLYSFERPKDQSENRAVTRASYGEELMSRLSGSATGTVAGSAGRGTACSGSRAITGSFASYVLAYAWPQYTKDKTEQMPEYKRATEAASQNGEYVGGNMGNDCGAFVTRIIRNSGVDPNYNSSNGNTTYQETYLKENWQSLGTGAQINTGDLLPGDVAIKDGHTFVFVGNIPGFDATAASASVGGGSVPIRAPMANQYEQMTSAEYTWYRAKAS